ncbi:Major facilitator superfamily transporter [Beauveria brongniartii RCEF 3172]|uniref:Major facilitator superfamily transporter n=1 Tax=Beauveria brongniartii RCEF 3172 TaxID=1081107 RepID=A0A167B1R8_9HYPO|nr:Major facilitator superfamily transporter [Beauveria brongniartii RCEF 3172]
MSVSPKTRRRGSHTSARREAEETTPLLAGGPLSSANVVVATSASHGSGPAPPPPSLPPPDVVDDDDDDKPLPGRQIFLLCYARTMEPIAFFSIFPYIAAMVQRNGRLPPSDVGFYSGLIESLFSLTQMAVLIVWGRLADRLGRKRVLVWSLAGMAVGPALFGLASTLPQMIAFRCLAGVFSGSALIIRTMIFDHCTPRTQASAFSWFAFAGNVGIFLGPIIGGGLADPAAQYPRLFGGWAFLERYPYAAPGFAVSAIAVTGVVTSVLFLEETLDYKDAHNKTRHQAGGGGDGDNKAERLTIWQLLRTRGIPTVLLVNGSVMIMAFAFTALLPVVLFTPVAIGGLGLSPFQISTYMAVQGLSQAVWLVGVFPRLHRRLGNKKLLTACAVTYPFFFLTYIVLNELLRVDTPAARAWAWVVGPLAAVVGPGVSMAFTGVQLALNDASPDPHVMGTLNGIALTLASALRSFVPGLTTALYAVGVREQILRGHLAWVVLIPVSMLMLIVIPMLPNDKQSVSPANPNDEAE